MPDQAASKEGHAKEEEDDAVAGGAGMWKMYEVSLIYRLVGPFV